MYQLIKPSLKFELFLIVDTSKTNSYRSQQNSNRNICYADGYDVSPDGSVTFFQTAKTPDDKRRKVPVLTYPAGKWEAISLLDDNNLYPVFNVGAQNNGIQSSAHKQQTAQDLLNELEESHETPQQPYNRTYHGSNTSIPTINMNMPGISNNPQEFRKAKNEWLEKHIKTYVRTVDSFKTPEFISFIQKDPMFKNYKPNEPDIQWASAGLIREKNVVARKFADPMVQKTLGLILPELMKRQWDGKMAPILEALTDREETKNVTAVDLAVWMAQNNIN